MESSENAIEVRNVSKHFKVFYDKGNELKERMLIWKRNKFELRKVLDNISFSIKKGKDKFAMNGSFRHGGQREGHSQEKSYVRYLDRRHGQAEARVYGGGQRRRAQPQVHQSQ